MKRTERSQPEALAASVFSLREKWVVVLLIFMLGAGVYANSFPGDFFVDDVHLVAENPLVSSIDIPVIFTSDYWGPNVNKSGVFRPLTILSFGVNRLLFGSQPWSFHLVNVFLHALVGVVFLHLLQHWGLSKGVSFFAAALFAVHPFHAEVLNQAVGRSELLVALFYLLALRWCGSEARGSWVVAAFFYLLALLSKEHAVTFIAALVLSDVFLGRTGRKRLALYGGILAVTAAWLLYREFGLVYGPENTFRNTLQANIIYQPLAAMETSVRIMTALKVQLLFLGKLLLPINLQAVYSGPAVSAPLKSMLSGWGSSVIMAFGGLVGVAFYGWWHRHISALAIVLYGLCFSVTANIFFTSGVVMAERSAYLPSVWFCLGLVGLFPKRKGSQGWRGQVAAGLLGLLVLMAGSATWVRNYDYRDQVRLWSLDFERDSRNTLAGIYLIDAYVQREEYGQAAEVARKIYTHHPDYLENIEMLAWLLVRDGKPQEALKFAELAAGQRQGDVPDGLVKTLVEINVLLQRPAEILKWLNAQNTEGQPGFYWQLKGNAYADLGELRRAVACYRRVGEPPPGSDMPYRLEQVLLQLGEVEEAGQVRRWIAAREARQKALSR